MTKNGKASLPSIICLLPFLLSAMFISCNAQAEVYKWVDENGRVHFGDRPPNKVQAEDIADTLKEINVSTDLSSPQMIQKAEQARRDQKKQEYQQQVRQNQTYEQEVSTWCREAKARLHNLQGRVRFYDEEGNDVYVSEEERKQREENLRSEIDRNCD